MISIIGLKDAGKTTFLVTLAAELVRLNAIAGEYDGVYTSHVRNRDSGILDAIRRCAACALA